ncbi:MAG: hypothetical protein WCQ64_11135 [Acidobacteriota bacterium]
MTDDNSKSDINISRIAVGGIGGIGMMFMAGVVAYALEPLRWPAVAAVVGGVGLGLSLIAARHRRARPYAIAGLVVLGVAVLMIVYIARLQPSH